MSIIIDKPELQFIFVIDNQSGENALVNVSKHESQQIAFQHLNKFPRRRAEILNAVFAAHMY